jgi:mRNA-degrading endonuclease RelE of RelBE toxin-antitoxin system
LSAWSVQITPPARRDLKRLDPPIQRRILDAVQRRLRIGDWRVRFSFDDDQQVIVVRWVLPRGRAYDR